MFRGGGSSEDVEVNIEESVNRVVNLPIFCANFFRSNSFLSSSHFGSGSVFIGSTNVNGVVSS